MYLITVETVQVVVFVRATILNSREYIIEHSLLNIIHYETAVGKESA